MPGFFIFAINATMLTVNLQRVPSFYHNYINLVRSTDLTEAFTQHQKFLTTLLQSLPADKWDYKYAEGKWSVKEVTQHLIDAERIFCYRALCFSRKEGASLPGFDENNYVSNSYAAQRPQEDLLEELKNVQQSSALLFASFNEEQLESTGIANGASIYVKAIGYIIIGHVLHHVNILNERYLIKNPA
jgi:hypothetical protein